MTGLPTRLSTCQGDGLDDVKRRLQRRLLQIDMRDPRGHIAWMDQAVIELGTLVSGEVLHRFERCLRNDFAPPDPSADSLNSPSYNLSVYRWAEGWREVAMTLINAMRPM